MAHLRKDAPGTAAGRLADGTDWTFTWDEPGQVLEVPDEVALDLARILDGGYHLADAAPDAAVEEPAPQSEISEAPAPRKRAAAKKTTEPAPVEE